MKAKKRFLAAILAALMLAGCFVGCKPDGSKPPKPPDYEPPPPADYYSERAEREYNAYVDPANLWNFPISFFYNDRAYKGFGEFAETDRVVEKDEVETGDGKTRTVKTRTVITLEFKDGLVAMLDAVFYVDYGAYEWTVYFENTWETNTGVISNFVAADITFTGENPILRGINGDCHPQPPPRKFPETMMYEQYAFDLEKADVNFYSHSGRPSHDVFPYYNLEIGDGGYLMALGWGGTWQADFNKAEGGARYRGKGAIHLNTYLKPGESIRTPLMLFVRYDVRDEHYATNLWRSYYFKHIMPQDEDGKPIFKPGFTLAAHSIGGHEGSNETLFMQSYEKAKQYGITGDTFYHDAGWYTNADGKSVPSWSMTGTWELDAKRFPSGFKKIKEDIKAEHSILWFEPERIGVNADLLEQNYGFLKSWILPNSRPIADYTNEDCLEWVFNTINNVITEQGITVYREDFNVEDPSNAWYNNDAADRKGITEIKYLVNHYKLWDRLIETHPGLMIDSCASGGGRNDLETMRRTAFIATKSDFLGVDNFYKTLGVNTSLFAWLPSFCSVPYQTTWSGVVTDISPYAWRINYGAMMAYGIDLNNDEDFYKNIKKCMDEWKPLTKYMFSDYYLLTDYEPPGYRDNFVAYQFFDRESGSGYIQAFRQVYCIGNTMTLKIQGVDGDKYYSITDVDDDGNNIARIKGSDLKSGITYTFPMGGTREKSAILMINPA